MDALESIIKFISSYPSWAKALLFGNFICIAATLVFAPRVVPETHPTMPSNTYKLRIDRVELFPPSNSAVVQVLAIVNGTQFRYPSIGGVEWMKVAPTMAGQTFRLPSAERYELRFEMLKKEDGASDEAKLLSVETISFANGSTEGRYALHGFDPASRTRSGEISAEIIYSIHPTD